MVKEIGSAVGTAEFLAADLTRVAAVEELAAAAGAVDAYYLTAAIAPKMAERGRGSVINVGSMAGQIGLAGVRRLQRHQGGARVTDPLLGR